MIPSRLPRLGLVIGGPLARFLSMAGRMASFDSDSYILSGIADQYSGVTVSPDDAALLQASTEVFDATLARSLTHWRQTKRRGVWLRIPIARSEIVPVAVKHGFAFHHAKPDYLMLNQWLSDEPNQMPHFATHYVGCAGVVVNDKNEVLVVTERYSAAGGKWKVPGGLADPGESLVDAAVREVFEETGIRTEFVSLLSFREKHPYLWSCSDLYFAVRLRPLTTEIAFPPGEIAECRWMPVDEFASIETYPTQMVIAQLLKKGAQEWSTVSVPPATPQSGGPMVMYCGKL